MNINEPHDLMPGYKATNVPRTHILVIMQKSMEKLCLMKNYITKTRKTSIICQSWWHDVRLDFFMVIITIHEKMGQEYQVWIIEKLDN